MVAISLVAFDPLTHLEINKLLLHKATVHCWYVRMLVPMLLSSYFAYEITCYAMDHSPNCSLLCPNYVPEIKGTQANLFTVQTETQH